VWKSSIGKIGGTKDNPLPVPALGKGFFLQEDNVAVEYNIPPAGRSTNFVSNNERMLEEIARRADALGLKPVIAPSAEFPVEELLDERAQVFGCDPDFCAWTLRMNPRPHCDNPVLRSAGGHIHVGTKLTDPQKVLVARWMDLLVAVPLMMFDTDTQRRLLYGRPGAMRFKKYGLEYRTASNWWLKSTKLMESAFTGAIEAVKLAKLDRTPSQDLANWINAVLTEGTKDEAKVLYANHGRGIFDGV
jgi:hypothetical protein